MQFRAKHPQGAIITLKTFMSLSESAQIEIWDCLVTLTEGESYTEQYYIPTIDSPGYERHKI